MAPKLAPIWRAAAAGSAGASRDRPSPTWSGGSAVAGELNATPEVEDHLCGVLEVTPIDSFHLLSEARVLYAHIKLPIDDSTRDVQVSGTDARPNAVHNSGFCVHHRAVPLEDTHPGLE